MLGLNSGVDTVKRVINLEGDGTIPTATKFILHLCPFFSYLGDCRGMLLAIGTYDSLKGTLVNGRFIVVYVSMETSSSSCHSFNRLKCFQFGTNAVHSQILH